MNYYHYVAVLGKAMYLAVGILKQTGAQREDGTFPAVFVKLSLDGKNIIDHDAFTEEANYKENNGSDSYYCKLIKEPNVILKEIL